MADAPVLIATLIIYKLVLLAIGLAAERRTQSESDFLLGGRGLGPLVAAISASASSSSVWTLLGVSGLAYSTGLASLWLLPACIGGFAINWYLVAPRLQARAAAGDCLTVTELLAGPARGPAFALPRVLASLILVVSLTAYVASQLLGAGKSFETTLGASLTTSVLVGSGVVLAYTILGGFWAVSLTDTIQGLMMAATALALPVGGLIAVGGLGALVDGVREVPVEGYAELFGGRPAIDGLLYVAALLGIALGYPGQAHAVNRFMALHDAASVRPARRYAMAWAFLVYPGMILVGLTARVLHTADPVADPEQAFFQLNGELFPPVVAGIMLAAVLSAIMSTADSQLLVASSAVSHDLGWRSSTPRGDLLRSRLVVLAVSLVAVAAALSIDATIFDSVLSAWSSLGAAFGPLLLATLWRGPVGPRATTWALLTGFGLSVLACSIPATKGTAVERVLPFVVSGAIAWTGARRR